MTIEILGLLGCTVVAFGLLNLIKKLDRSV